MLTPSFLILGHPPPDFGFLPTYSLPLLLLALLSQFHIESNLQSHFCFLLNTSIFFIEVLNSLLACLLSQMRTVLVLAAVVAVYLCELALEVG